MTTALEFKTASPALKEEVKPVRRGRPPKLDKTVPNSAHVTYPESLSQRLQEIQRETHAGSIAEVFRRSLVVFAALWEAHKRGEDVILRDKNGKERQIIGLF